MNNNINTFSYQNYSKLLKKYKSKLISFDKALYKKNFVILRHDVEFSMIKALEMAKIEFYAGVKSTYFFQVYSNSYNLLSINNRKILDEIISMGHKAGLHFYTSHIKKGDWKSLYAELDKQKKIFNLAHNKTSLVFSFHRPQAWLLENKKDKIKGLINSYGESFFEFKSNPQKIKYYADSRRNWDYGNPLKNNNFKKIQILIHPDFWSDKPLTNKQQLNQLIKKDKENFLFTIDEELSDKFFLKK